VAMRVESSLRSQGKKQRRVCEGGSIHEQTRARTVDYFNAFIPTYSPFSTRSKYILIGLSSPLDTSKRAGRIGVDRDSRAADRGGGEPQWRKASRRDDIGLQTGQIRLSTAPHASIATCWRHPPPPHRVRGFDFFFNFQCAIAAQRVVARASRRPHSDECN
jgi:hypothetical protein